MDAFRTVESPAAALGSAGTRDHARSRWSVRAGWALLVALWLGMLGYGAHQHYLHATTPGALDTTPATFPSGARLPRDPGLSTLAMFVHPECPCTRASLHELAALLAEPGLRVRPILVVAPTMGADQRWEETPTAAIAARIPDLRVFADHDEAEALRFGAATSGYVALYDAQGTLRFAGGITGSRGHVGDNAGRAAVRAQLREVADATGTPRDFHEVFGCALRAALRDEEPTR